MPSLKVHRKWQAKILNYTFKEIDKFIDDNRNRDLDIKLVRESISECAGTVTTMMSFVVVKISKSLKRLCEIMIHGEKRIASFITTYSESMI